MFNQVAIPVTVSDMIEARNQALNLIIHANKSLSKANEALKGVAPHLMPCGARLNESSITKMTHDLDSRLWRRSFDLAGFYKVMDETAMNEFEASLGKEPPEFNMDNIQTTFLSMAAEADTIFKRGIVNVFKHLSKDYKTNSKEPFKIGKKIICSYMADLWCGLKIRYEYSARLNDIDRVFRIVAGEEHQPRSLEAAVNAAWAKGEDYECDFYKIRGFQKGTVHIWFKRPDLLDKVNGLINEYYQGNAIPDARQ